MDGLLTILPPFPASDWVARNEFIPVKLMIQPPASYCRTSRRETGVATSATANQAAPFDFEQSKTHTPASCASGWSIAIPALSQRALYYRSRYRDAAGQVIETSQARVALTQ